MAKITENEAAAAALAVTKSPMLSRLGQQRARFREGADGNMNFGRLQA